jgi:ATP-binding cassette, subfamily C, bacterial
MRQIFKIFFEAEGTRPWLVLLCLLFGGFAEALGIGSLLPLISSVTSGNTGQPSALETIVQNLFQWMGLTPSFGTMVLFVMAIMFVRSALLFGAMSYAAARVAIRFRRNLVRSVLEARWSYYANNSVGQLANHVSNDSTAAGGAYITFANAAACAVQIAAYVLVAMLINWKVALAGILGGILIAIASNKLVQITRRTGIKNSARIGQVTEELVDLLGNIKALKSMERQGPTLNHVDSIIARLKKTLFAQSLARYGLVYGNDFLVAVMVAIGAWFAISLGKIEITQVLITGVLFFQVISYASKLQKQYQAASEFYGAYARVSGAVENAQIARETFDGTELPEIGKGITFKRVSFQHDETQVLNNLDLYVPANAITVIQGPSGAGKTTILDLVVGFHRPGKGQILVGNEDLSKVDLKKWRSTIGYVPQELALFHDTVTNNITLYDETISEAQLEEAVHLSGVSEFLEKLPNGLATDVGEFGGKLSGGQRQRISLARALVHKPKLLIFDEVTSALDPANEKAIVSNIAALRGKYTIMVITHRPSWTRIADRLYTLENGRAKLEKVKGRKAK